MGGNGNGDGDVLGDLMHKEEPRTLGETCRVLEKLLVE